eukprot:TRINITY_DN8666_c0_g1_i1.p1 TRINITY_DN8666_c0_g1~~TRINITY_DN8666_c0_g1_i1.p1  ORF type:complete len:396 (+),score=59.93 TRINITY_DN8666_c0_g1_i1:95-1282(+)
MAWSAHSDPEQIKEIFDSEEQMEKNVDKIVNILNTCKHVVFFTGAGISTSAGIPDFRGPDGVWTLQAQGRRREKKSVDTLRAIPTPTHMAIKKLLEVGKAKYLISQNVDGLHRRSGVSPQHVAELHGNTNLEKCETCGNEYLRDYHVRNNPHVHKHYTGRKCPCGGPLMDTIINFGENLPEKELQNAFEHSDRADACIVLGSSLTVTPAATCPKMVAKHGGQLVICNLQRTPLDDRASVRVYAYTDELMKRVMKKLDLEIPKFKLHRRISIKTSVRPKSDDPKSTRWSVTVKGIEEDGTPATIFKSVTFKYGKTTDQQPCSEEPFRVSVTQKVPDGDVSVDLKISFEFFGHYLEPTLEIQRTVNLKSDGKVRNTAILDYLYDPTTRLWEEDKREA